MQRRLLLQAGAALAATPFLQSAAAQAPAGLAFPRLRIVVPANPGGGWDQTGRALGAALQAAGQAGEVEFENKGGKGGVIGLAHFVEKYDRVPSALMVGGFVMVGSIALNRPAVDLTRVTPIARLTSELLAVAVAADSKYRTLQALATELKARPAGIVFAGGGAGGVDHMCVGMIARALNIDPSSVNYQPFASGTEVAAAVASGKATVAVSGYGELKDSLAGGRLRALGISARRTAFGVPSLADQGLNVVLSNWRGVFGAPGLDAAQQAALREAVLKATHHASWKDALQRNSWQPAWQSGAEFQASLDFDQSMARVVVHLLKLKPA
jgi:putative tricarboxylic transport membrane protein